MIRLGEWIAFQNKEGRVVDINWARTVIDTADGQRVYIPNTLLLNGVFSNFTAGNPANQVLLKVSASYEVAPGRVKATLLKCLDSVPGVSPAHPPQACLLEYADSGVVYGLYYWIDDYTQRLQIQDEVATRVWYAFQREGIPIPYPTRTLHLDRTSDIGKKMRIGLNKTIILMISKTVSKAVLVVMVLSPANLCLMIIGCSFTKCRWWMKIKVMTSLKAMESGQRGA